MQPSRSGTVNGLPAVLYDGVDDALAGPTAMYVGADGTWSCLAVGRRSGDGLVALANVNTYAVGDKVTEAGQAYECLVAHGAERQGTWRPSVTIGTVWRKL